MPNENPWVVDERDFPRSGPDRAKLEFLVRYAILAPSHHNSQPWIFRLRDEALELFADRSRALPASDPDDRELTISCGKALGNLEVAAHNFGLAPETQLLPDSGNRDLLACVRLTAGYVPTSSDISLFGAIPHRHTSRVAFKSKKVPSVRLAEFESIADRHGVEAQIVTDDVRRKTIATLVAESWQRQMANPDFRRELSDWIRSRKDEAREGMSLASLGKLDVLSGPASKAVRAVDVGEWIADRDQQLARQAPVLIVLATATDGPRDWMQAGAALAELLLAATLWNIRTGFFTQAIELPALRQRLKQAADCEGIPQMLIRLGYGAEVPPSARRPASEVIRS